jgi:hypothetical protein
MAGTEPKHEKRIILQDLNVALTTNFDELKKNQSIRNFIQEKELYRGWLVDLLRHEYVILCTVRSGKYRADTLDRIKLLTNWEPDEALFNTWVDPKTKRHLSAHLVKRRFLTELIMPKFGDDPSKYLAIESNHRSREMYRSLGVKCLEANTDDSSPWKRI